MYLYDYESVIESKDDILPCEIARSFDFLDPCLILNDDDEFDKAIKDDIENGHELGVEVDLSLVGYFGIVRKELERWLQKNVDGVVIKFRCLEGREKGPNLLQNIVDAFNEYFKKTIFKVHSDDEIYMYCIPSIKRPFLGSPAFGLEPREQYPAMSPERARFMQALDFMSFRFGSDTS